MTSPLTFANPKDISTANKQKFIRHSNNTSYSIIIGFVDVDTIDARMKRPQRTSDASKCEFCGAEMYQDRCTNCNDDGLYFRL